MITKTNETTNPVGKEVVETVTGAKKFIKKGSNYIPFKMATGIVDLVYPS